MGSLHDGQPYKAAICMSLIASYAHGLSRTAPGSQPPQRILSGLDKEMCASLTLDLIFNHSLLSPVLRAACYAAPLVPTRALQLAMPQMSYADSL